VKSKPAALLILVVILGLLLPAEALAQFTVPTGFVDQPVVAGVPAPTAIAWLPNDDLLIATQGGVLFLSSGGGAALSVLNLTGSVCASGEMGLLGLAVDPDFSGDSGNIFLYYTNRRGDGSCANRVSRFTLGPGGAGNEQVLIDNIPAPGGNHNGGDLQFGNDGVLYVSVGDGGQDLQTGAGQNGNGNARRLDLLNGKILRINKDGSIPANNPFRGAGTVQCGPLGAAPGALPPPQNQEQKQTQEKKKNKKKHKRGGKHKKGGKSKKKKRADRRDEKRKRRQERREASQPPPASTGPSGSSLICQEIFATGLRNPFRIAFDPDSAQRFYINDVGGGAWEEIDNGATGADYGWNVREGPCLVGSQTNCPPDNQFVGPVFAYPRNGPAPFNGCTVITGGAFVPNNGNNWPDNFDDAYLFTDLGCGKLFALRGEGSGATVELFATGSGAIQLKFKDGVLYYTTFAGGGQVRRIVHPG
jgi:glucose/arabinose dehydrogenase